MQIIGETIPFKRLGYGKLEDFLRSIPEIKVNCKAGDILIEAKEVQSSSHVTELVSKQKKTVKKKFKVSSIYIFLVDYLIVSKYFCFHLFKFLTGFIHGFVYNTQARKWVKLYEFPLMY